MKKIILSIIVLTGAFLFPVTQSLYANQPDSTYIFAYANEKNAGRECNPGDKNAKPERSSIVVSKELKPELPAYSFTVIRIKNK